MRLHHLIEIWPRSNACTPSSMGRIQGLFCFWPFSRCQLSVLFACPSSSFVFPPPFEFWHARQTRGSDREKKAHTQLFQIHDMFPASKLCSVITNKNIKYQNTAKTSAIQFVLKQDHFFWKACTVNSHLFGGCSRTDIVGLFGGHVSLSLPPAIESKRVLVFLGVFGVLSVFSVLAFAWPWMALGSCGLTESTGMLARFRFG